MIQLERSKGFDHGKSGTDRSLKNQEAIKTNTNNN